jgi:predicted nucleic acid-binding protein
MEKQNIKSPKIQMFYNKKDSIKLPSKQSFSKFNNLDELVRLPRRHQPVSSFCKNAFIETIKKEIETKVNEKINFERNPHGFLLNNLKELIQRQIIREKEGFKKVNDKLDELFIYLIKSVDKNYVKTK